VQLAKTQSNDGEVNLKNNNCKVDEGILMLK